ncbi:VWA domain-containing protein [Aeromonas jandaei]|nr:VWA domain-containing protein [Aeromonas jandaei]
MSANLVKLVGTITDKDGDSQSASVDLGSAISFKDDGPSATAATNSGQATQGQNTNLMLILDISGSMGNASGYQGMTRMEVMQKSALELLDRYDASGNVMVNIVTFSTAAANPTGTWVTVDAAKAIILGLSPTDSTNYDDALNDAINAFGAGGKLAGAQNVSYFMSDGAPNYSTVSNSATVPMVPIASVMVPGSALPMRRTGRIFSESTASTRLLWEWGQGQRRHSWIRSPITV